MGKIIISEFNKGNVYWSVYQKRSKNIYEIVKILDIRIYNNYLKAMTYKSYRFFNRNISLEDKESYSTGIRDWNFDQFNFYILSKEEASPYIKEIIVAELENK